MKKPTSAPPIAEQAGADRGGHRIAKLLARAGIASRREIERMIADGRVALNGAAIDTPATLLSSLHGVTVDGQPVQAAAPARLFRFHKSAGLLTAERDPAGRPTIYDRLPKDLPRLIPVGRLDLNTEGLLLLTTDGELKRQLELPSTGVTRSYRARAFGAVSQEQLEELIHGIEIEGIRYGAIDANLERRTGRNQWIEMRLTEGKNREVRRVLEHLGLQVSRLIRTSYGPFPLADLPPGAVDEIRQHDLIEFRRSLAKGTLSSFLPEAAGDRPPQTRAPAAAPGRGRAAPAGRPTPRPGSIRTTAQAAPSRRSADASAPRSPEPRPPRPPRDSGPARAPRDSAPGRPRRGAPTADRDSLHHRPPRAAASDRPARKTRSAPAPAPAAPDKPARPKRGAGWAKAKPRPSSRPTPRGGGGGKRPPTNGRPSGGKK